MNERKIIIDKKKASWADNIALLRGDEGNRVISPFQTKGAS